jgi:hypothetical protein
MHKELRIIVQELEKIRDRLETGLAAKVDKAIGLLQDVTSAIQPPSQPLPSPQTERDLYPPAVRPPQPRDPKDPKGPRKV